MSLKDMKWGPGCVNLLKEKNREPLIFSVTLNWNTKSDTAECMKSIQTMDYSNIRSVIVDNGSTDGSVDYLRNVFGDRIEIIENRENLGYSVGFNIGIKHAMKHNPDYILIHNSDVVFMENTINELLNVARMDERIGFVGAKILYHNNPNVIQSVGRNSDPDFIVGKGVGHDEIDVGQYETIREFDFIDDPVMLVNAQVIKEVGPYDPIFFLMFEINDWCLRVRRNGFKIMYAPKAKILHKGSLSSGGRGNPSNKYYLIHYQIVFMKKNASPELFRKFLFKSLTRDLLKDIIVYTVKGRFDVVKATIRGKITGLMWLLNTKGTRVYKY